MKHPFIYVILLTFSLWNCQKDAPGESEEEEEVVEKIAPTLPLYAANLNDLSEFDSSNAGWKIVGKTYTDFADGNTFQTEEGSGLLLIQAAKDAQLSTNMEHADLILELDYMLSKDARAKILFQEIYPLTLMDSWGKSDNENGAIETNKSSTNVSRAPGLWQQLRAQFRAAKFDKQGNKTANARMDYIYLNDVLIQDSIEFTPTSSMTAEIAHLMFQVENGDLSIKNLKWKKLAQNRVKASNITYQLYRDLEGSQIPDFSQLEADTSGTVESFEDLEDLAQAQDHFGLIFEGNLGIPNDGDYLFETRIDDGGDFYIDDKLVVHNEGDPGMGTERTLVELTKGTHTFKVTYYDETWRAHLEIQIEGPGVEKHELFAEEDLPLWQKKTSRSLALEVEEKPIFQRAFVNYGNEKRTHTISVGDPVGIHYSYDLREGTLLKAWKGEFADVSAMWVGRGNDQLLKPLNAVVEFTTGVPLARLNSENSVWRDGDDRFKAKGYQVDENELPIFEYQLDEVEFTDRIRPVDGKIQRTLEFTGGKRGDLWYRVARSESIIPLQNGWYNVGGNYYLKINSSQEIKMRDSKEQKELILSVLHHSDTDEVIYEILW